MSSQSKLSFPLTLITVNFVKLYIAKGQSKAQIAKDLNRTVSDIDIILNGEYTDDDIDPFSAPKNQRKPYTLSKTKPRRYNIEEFKQKVNEGLTIRQLADYFGICASMVTTTKGQIKRGII